MVINEFLASNSAGLTDPQSEQDDWIEFYHAGDTPVDLAGYYLSDNAEDARRWRFPLNRADETTLIELNSKSESRNTKQIQISNHQIDQQRWPQAGLFCFENCGFGHSILSRISDSVIRI